MDAKSSLGEVKCEDGRGRKTRMLFSLMRQQRPHPTHQLLKLSTVIFPTILQPMAQLSRCATQT